MGNYDIATETRELKIQWARVLLQTQAEREPTSELPPPFDQIEFATGGTILGKEIYMGGNLSVAVDARIKKGNQTWKLVSRKISRNKAPVPKIRILLWNSMKSSTTIYGLRTRDLPRHLLDNMDAYMYNHLRMMMNPRCEIDERYPEKEHLYKTMQQSTMDSWLDKTQIVTMMTQTQHTKTIHPKECKEMLTPKIKLQAQW